MKATAPFVFYHDGINPTSYSAGDELPADAIPAAIAMGCAEKVEPSNKKAGK